MEYGRIVELINFGKSNDLSLIMDNDSYLSEVIFESFDIGTITQEQAEELSNLAEINLF